MAKNLYETADDTLRGEAGGQLTPEAQDLWNRYNNIYGTLQNTPTVPMKLKSGATMKIMDPSIYYQQRALQSVLKGMSGTGLASRNAPQPGMLAQLAPFVSALGSDPKFQKWLSQYFGNSQTTGGANVGTDPSYYAGTDEYPTDLGSSVPIDSVDLGDVDWDLF